MNPFVYDKPLPPARLIDREDELKKLLDTTASGTNCLLAGPRRYGKTTLLRRVLADAENEGTPTAFVDLDGARTLQMVAEAVDAAYQPLKTVRRKVADFLRGGGTFSISILGSGVGGGTTADTSASRALVRALKVPEKKQRRNGSPCLVVFDEFQNVLGVDAGGQEVDGLIRSVIQHQSGKATYIFSGSEPRLMSELFGNKNRPLYDQARPVDLDPLPNSALEQYVCAAFDATGRDARPAMPDFLRFVRGHPQRSMLLAHHLWSATQVGGSADGATWQRALDVALAEEAKFFSASWDALQDSEKEALRAVASDGAAAPFVVQRLITRGEILRERGLPRILDPLYETWLREGEVPARNLDYSDAQLILDLLERPVSSWPRNAAGQLFDSAAELKTLASRQKLTQLSRGEQEQMARDRLLVTRSLAEATGESESAIETKLDAILGI